MRPWLLVSRPRPDAALRLVCLPHAGGSATAFRGWPPQLPAIEVVCVELPGRGRRVTEPPCTSIEAVIQPLADAMSPLVATPFAIFGHSMGALLGFELARELRRRGCPAPTRLIVAGRPAPHLPHDTTHAALRAAASDDELVAQLRRLGGTPALMLDDPDVAAYILKIVRADLALVASVRHADEPPLDCPISALGGIADDHAHAAQLDAWAMHGRGFDRAELPGGHFFMQTAPAAFFAVLAQRLADRPAT